MTSNVYKITDVMYKQQLLYLSTKQKLPADLTTHLF